MTLRLVLAALALTLSYGGNAAARGVPWSPVPAERAADFTLVHNCHGDPQMGFVPQYGRDLYHAHDANCGAIILNGGQPDGRSRAPVQQQPRRVEPESKPRFAPQQQRPQQRYDDCHRAVRTHRVPGFSRPIAHRHVGPTCRIEIYERVREPRDVLPQRPLRPDGPCVQRGSVRYCEGM